MSVRTKIVLYNHVIEQVNSFNYLGYTTDLEIKMNRFNQTCSAIRRNLSNNTRKDVQKKLYKVIVVPVLT
jgi:hypothetical protein